MALTCIPWGSTGGPSSPEGGKGHDTQHATDGSSGTEWKIVFFVFYYLLGSKITCRDVVAPHFNSAIQADEAVMEGIMDPRLPG